MSEALKDQFIFGELFELAAIIGMYKLVEKLNMENHNIEIFADITIDDTSSFYIPRSLNKFEQHIEEAYEESLNSIEALIDQLTLGQPFDVSQFVSENRTELQHILEIAISHNIRNRSHYIALPTPSEIKKKVNELLNYENSLNVISIVNSGFNTGQYFIDFCILRYGKEFIVLVETEIEDEISSKMLKPDIMVIKDDQIVLVGDLKSYFPFLTSKFGSILKDVIGQIPFYITTKDIIDQSKMEISKMYISRFKSRWNLFLRYFKLLRYLNWVYKNAEDLDNLAANIDGVILFPSKPILLNVSNQQDIDKIRSKLRKMISYNIHHWDSVQRKVTRYQLNEKVKQIHGIDLEKEIDKGDLYIEDVPNEVKDVIEYQIHVKQYNSIRKKKEQITKIIYEERKFPTNKDNEKFDMIETEFTLNSEEYYESTRKKHSKSFASLLEKLDLDQERFNLFVDGSDQGIGKNFSFSEFVTNEIKEKKDTRILFACPRKEAIKQTIASLQENLEELKIVINLDYEELSKGNIIEDKDFNFRISIVQSDRIGRTPHNFGGSLQYRIKKIGSTAREKLENVLKSEYQGIDLVFVTSATLPSYIATKMTSRSLPTAEKLFLYFDIFVFDELTNSSPTVREVFIDLIKLWHSLKQNGQELKLHSFIVLDASITSFQLFEYMLKKLLPLNDSPYFLPSQELLEVDQDYEECIHREIKFEQSALNLFYLRQHINFPLKYGVITKSHENYYDPVKLEDLNSSINKLLEQTTIGLSFEELLSAGEVLIFVDNKSTIDRLQEEINLMGYNSKLVIMEEKDEHFKNFNVIGTNALAFGTSFPDKRLMLIFPPTSNTEYYQFKNIIELHRQVVKRMRGKQIEIERLIIYHAFPSKNDKSQNKILEEVNIDHGILKNYIQYFVNNRVYKQLPSFSSILNSPNWIQTVGTSITYDTLYHIFYYDTTNEDEIQYVSLEYFLKEDFPRLRRIFSKWGLILTKSFEIKFNSNNIVKRIPIPGFLPFKLSKTLLPRYFNINLIHFKSNSDQNDKNPMNLLEEYLQAPPENEILLLFNYINNRDDQIKRSKSEQLNFVKRELESLLQEIKQNIKGIKKQIEVFVDKLNSLFQIIHLETSGTSFLLSFEIAINKEDFYQNSSPNLFTINRIENDKYLRKLWALGSPLKSLFDGSSNYYEFPITVRFRNSTLNTIGFVCYFPRFKYVSPTSTYMQLFRKTLLHELFRENVFYIPNLLRDLFFE